jgi:predicted ATPase with chaperone activity
MKTLTLLFLPLTLSAQVTLTPMQVRTANVLLDERERLMDEREDARLELAAWQAKFKASEALRLNAEARLSQADSLATLEREGADVLRRVLAKSGRVTKRRERLLWVVGTIAAIEAVVIGVAYGLR